MRFEERKSGSAIRTWTRLQFWRTVDRDFEPCWKPCT